MTGRFGVQAAPLSPEIHAGTLSADGTLFTHKDDVTGMTLRAVADYAAKHFDGSVRVEFGDGLVLHVEVES